MNAISVPNTKNILRAAFPKIKEKFADIVVRFEGNQWSPLRVLDNFIDTEERIWLKALNIDIEFIGGKWRITKHPRRRIAGATDKQWTTDSLEELCSSLATFLDPYRA